MVKVTGKQYYLNGYAKEVMDICVERYKKKWDNLLVIDGEERAGKSTLARQLGYYYADCLGKKFTLDNVFFDPEEVMQFAITHQGEVIIWDEAAFGGMTSQWQNKIQQKLNQMLMVAGKYGHLFIFIIPSVFKLNWYAAVHRSSALFHVYSPDMTSRGQFTLFNRLQKAWIYNNNKKSETYKGGDVCDFTIGQSESIIDEDAYELKKDKAIQKYLKEDPGKELTELKVLKRRIGSLKPEVIRTLKTRSDLAKALSYPLQTIINWGINGVFSRNETEEERRDFRSYGKISADVSDNPDTNIVNDTSTVVPKDVED